MAAPSYQSGVATAEVSTTLGGNATRAGQTFDTGLNTQGGGWSRFRAFASSDVAGTLAIQQSRDNATWYTTVSQAVSAGSANGTVVESIIALRYVRAFYTNGAGAQAAFEFDTVALAI